MAAKVAHLVYSFGTGGLERVIVNLINGSHTAVDHQVITQVDDHSFSSKLAVDVPFFCIDKRDGTDLGSHWRLYKLLRKLKPDVLHTYNFGTLEYQFVAWLAGVKLLVHAEHGRESSYKKIANPAKYEYFRRLIAVFINYFVVVSPDLESWAKDRIKLSDRKLRLVYNGIDLNEFGHSRASDSVFDPSSTSAVFVSVGRLVDVKNHALLIQAFYLARKSTECGNDSGAANEAIKRARLVIVGDGPNCNALQQQVKTLGLEDSVELMGHCDDVPAVLNRATVFVLSSRYEAQPMTALEAMAYHLPIIATDVGGVSHIIENHHNGLLVASEDEQGLASALCYMLNNPAAMQEMGTNGRRLVEQSYSVEAMAGNYLQLYGVNGDSA